MENPYKYITYHIFYVYPIRAPKTITNNGIFSKNYTFNVLLNFCPFISHNYDPKLRRRDLNIFSINNFYWFFVKDEKIQQFDFLRNIYPYYFTIKNKTIFDDL